ncbi:family 43 glycosylhydrolase [Allobranchiibius huperziae]|uniref:GH43 family beta-xylosidase n=1 Tax=Allobranchiibius huperziae TaxID=1874116 RepID=A0A853DMA9_9MICO|nr:GH43 family beta-xylosidase [Allobranchiibius huperziae]
MAPAAHAAASYPAPRIGSKITDKNVADPSLLAGKHGGYYYLYATGPGGIAVYRSGSPGRGYAYDRTISFRGYSLEWAPHVVYNSHRYVLFFTAKSTNNSARNNTEHYVYVAASTAPDRGFTAYSALKCDADIRQGWEAIDPTTYYSAAARTSYLAWRRGHVVGFPGGQYQIMAEAITYHSSGKPVTLTARKGPFPLTPIQNTVIEAPSLIYQKNRLWLFVSRGAFNTATGKNAYYTQVWQGAKLGLLANPRPVMTSGAKYGYGPGAAEVTTTNGTHYIAYEYITSGSGTKNVVRHIDIATVSWATGGPVVG